MPTLADEVDYGPVFLPLLQKPVLQIGQLTPPEPASEQDRKDRTVSFALQSLRVGRCHSRRASCAVSHLPSLMPIFLTPFTRRIPAAISGLHTG